MQAAQCQAQTQACKRVCLCRPEKKKSQRTTKPIRNTLRDTAHSQTVSGNSMNTEKKNQHYLPKFYLKYFSFEANKKQIGIYCQKNGFCFEKAALKHQGSKNFYYGQDGKLEDALGDIEGELSHILNEIINTKKPPSKYSQGHSSLLLFVALTHLRNPASVSFIQESTERMRDRLREMCPTADLDKIYPSVTHEEAVALSLSSLNLVIDTMLDLEFKLLINNTKEKFISSDFPIVKYNQFLESRNWLHGRTGYGTIGLQIFIPINPDLMIVFFDSKIYKSGTRKSSIVGVENIADIRQLNSLQVINCFSTLFFNHEVSKHEIQRIVNGSKGYVKANTAHTTTSRIANGNEKLEDIKEDNLIIVGSTDPTIGLNLLSLRPLASSKYIVLSNKVAQMRPGIEKIRKNYR